MNKLIPIVISLSLIGCASTGNYQRRLNTWMGSDAKDLISVFGYPNETKKAPNGNDVYAYYRANSYVTPSYQMPGYTTGNVITVGQNQFDYRSQVNGSVIQGQTVSFYCNTYFEIDGNQKIVNWVYQGNGCAE